MTCTWRLREPVECFQELVDLPVRRCHVVKRYEVPNVLQVFKRLGREEVPCHCAYLAAPRCNLQHTLSRGIPLPASNCASPRSIFCRPSASRCCRNCSCSYNSRSSSRITSDA